MTLDMVQVAAHIEDLLANMKLGEQDRRRKLDFAVETLESRAAEFNQLRQKIEASKTTWLVAGPTEEVDRRQPVLPCPENFIVLGSDGSNIDVDRHHSARCFLINIGIAQLQYGQNPDALLYASPFLYFKDEEIVVSASDGRVVPIEGQLLGLKRSVEECRLLAERASEIEVDLPVVALIDGSLILWGLAGQAYPGFVADELLANGFLKHLEVLKELSQNRQLGVASYISFPRSTDVVNALRVAICPHQPADCDRYCSGELEGKECDQVAGLLDRDLFGRLLAAGERSAIFGSRSSVVRKYYADHEIHFFYVKVDDEIARVEIPLWVANDKELVGVVHSAILHQCRGGLGYPVALSEAHEQAVVTAADRQQFWELVEQTLARDRIGLESSAKRDSKRRRWV